MRMDLKKLDEVSILSEKLRTSGLTEEEEKRWCELNSELTGFPEDFFTKTFQDKLDDVLKAVESAGYAGIMITEIKGHGKQKGLVQQWRGSQYKVSLLTKIKLEIVAKNRDVEKIKTAIASTTMSK